MLQELSNLVVADNTGAKRAMCFRILKQRKEYAHLGIAYIGQQQIDL